MTSPNCTGAPLSWLVMEQYHLGELPQNERQRVRAHLHSCPGCAECMDSIENFDIRLKPLPEIPSGFLATVTRQWKWRVGAMAMVAASALMLVLVLPFTTTQTATIMPPVSMEYKGGDLAIGLTRYRDRAVDEKPSKYKDGDAFSVRVTCPPIGAVSWDVIIFQGNNVYFPYDNQQPLDCRNDLELDGTFTLSGQAATTICITIDESINRSMVSPKGFGALPDSTVCTTVRPVE